MDFPISGLWEDQNEITWDEPKSIKFNNKVYECKEGMGCGCPMLLCTGDKTCERHDENPIKCKLTKAHEKIDLQNAKLEYFFKGSGDCKCYTL